MSTGTAPPPSPLERPLSREGRRRLRSRGTNSIGSSGYSSAPGARELRRGRVPFPKPKFPKNHFSVKKGKRRKPKMMTPDGWNDNTRQIQRQSVTEEYIHDAERGSVKWTKSGWATGGGFRIEAYESWNFATAGRTEVTNQRGSMSKYNKPWRSQGSRPHRGAPDFPTEHKVRGDPSKLQRVNKSVNSAFGSTLRTSTKSLREGLSTPTQRARTASSRSARAAQSPASTARPLVHTSPGSAKKGNFRSPTTSFATKAPAIGGVIEEVPSPLPGTPSMVVTQQTNPVRLSVFAIGNGREYIGGASTWRDVPDSEVRHRWSPTMRLSRSAAQLTGGRETVLTEKTGADVKVKATADVKTPLPAHEDASSNTRRILSHQRSAPAAEFGVRRKTALEMLESLGHLDLPGPGENCEIPSFVQDDQRQHKGVVFGHKLPDKFELEERLGMRHGPAPGGDGPVPSFVHEARVKNRGFKFGDGFGKSKRGWDVRPGTAPAASEGLGREDTHAGWVTEGKGAGKAVGGVGIKWKQVDAAVKGDTPLLPAQSFVDDNLRENKGVVFASSRPPPRKPEQRPAPGDHHIPSFVEENAAADRGVKFGKKLKTQEEILEAIGFGETPGPIYDVRAPTENPWDPPVDIYGTKSPEVKL